MSEYLEKLDSLLGPEGVLPRAMPGFVFRPEQHQLSRAIGEAFLNDEFLLAEAGTGVGKSFAYLIPAILWALENKEKVVIATRTRALQNQLLAKDIPALQAHAGKAFRCVQVKGRENYLCLTKYHQIIAGRQVLNTEQQALIEKILNWAETTRTGDRMELDLNASLGQHWFLLSADRHHCQRDRCRFQERCFRLKVARQAKNADLIITNHAMLLADLATGSQVLPDFDRLIIDEAHVFPQEVFEQTSFRFAREELAYLLGFLCQKEKGKSRGFLLGLKHESEGRKILIGEACEAAIQSGRHLGRLFKQAGLAAGEPQATSVHLGAGMDVEWLDRMVEIHDELYQSVMLMSLKLKEIADDDPDLSQLNDYALMFEHWVQNCRSLLDSWIFDDERLCWMDCYNGTVKALCSASLDQSQLIDSLLYRKMASVVMVSATLTVDNDFSAMVERAALLPCKREGRLREFAAGSPFDYEQNARLFLVEDLPDPTHPRFDSRVADLITQLINPAWGKTMLLFTSRRSMSLASAAIRPVCRERGVELLVQNEDGDFAAIMKRFTSLEHAVLAGLETYWEGVDLKGDLLKLLVIVKVPFRSPADPFYSAWERYYRSTGQNAFTDFMLPDAALRFKQGAGRLIRSEEDTGALVVLDRRLISRPYGRIIMNSIPIQNAEIVGSQDLAERLRRWL